jgi:hypothetical protein
MTILELSAIFPAGKYTWLTWTSLKPAHLEAKGGRFSGTLKKGEQFGVRPATSKKGVYRVVLKNLGMSHVFSYDQADVDKLVKKSTHTASTKLLAVKIQGENPETKANEALDKAREALEEAKGKRKEAKTKEEKLSAQHKVKTAEDRVKVAEDHLREVMDKKGSENEKAAINESYQPPILNVGDKILKGKFKNSPAEVKGFQKDKHNQPVLKTNKGDVQLFKPRITKLMDIE